MRARLALVLPMVLLIAAALGGQPALAKGPVTEPLIPAPATTFHGICDFAVTFEEVDPGQFITTWPNGKVLIEGPTWTRVTNEETGDSVVLDTSATFTITPHGDGSTTIRAEGRSLFFFFAGDLGAGESGALWYMNGLFMERFTFDGETFTLHSHKQIRGTRENLCETLA
jgi:hypothetical protein